MLELNLYTAVIKYSLITECNYNCLLSNMLIAKLLMSYIKVAKKQTYIIPNGYNDNSAHYLTNLVK